MTECIEWTGALSSGRYGARWYKGKMWGAHRAAWDEQVGPIPDGLIVCHSCDNPRCINVAHLFLGTHADNAADRSLKGRGRGQADARCSHGHEFTPENTYQFRGGRVCRACNARRAREYRARRATAGGES